MVSKLKELEKSDENDLVEAVCGSAHQIWQAGLGAFAKAREEGSELFDKLVQQGVDLQKRMPNVGVESGLGLTDTVTRMAETVGKQASGSWEKLEKVFEDRVSRSLRNLGVPTQDDVKAVSRQIAALQKSVDALAAKKANGSMSEQKTGSAKAGAQPKAAVKAGTKSSSKSSTKSSVKSAALKGTTRATTRKPARAAAGHA